MTYRLRQYKQVTRFLRKCDKDLARRIRKRFTLLKANPFLYIQHLEISDCYKLRIGDYRAIIDIDENMISVRYIAHRSKVYKQFR